jgi:hypothetical protein
MHDCPSAHFVAHEPPQSTSVSLPFCALSVHVGATQKPPEQLLDSQSLLVLQVFVRMHFDGHAAPQSISASVPFLTPSLHVGV